MQLEQQHALPQGAKPPRSLVSSRIPIWRSSTLNLNLPARIFTSSLKSTLPSEVKKNTIFLQSKENLKNYLEANEFNFDDSLAFLKKELSFIKDGHFYIDKPKTYEEAYDYAIKYGEFEGIPLIDCKKFYYNTEEEKIQLMN